MTCTVASPDVDVLLDPDDLRKSLETDARAGLSAHQKHLAPKYFYDARGSRLFEQITELPEYYQTRTEYAILRDNAAAIVHAADADVLLELGSGSSTKTRALLDAMSDRGALSAYVPVDVSPDALRGAVAGLRRDYPRLPMRGAVADFDRHLRLLPAPGKRLIAFLGGTIGNYEPARRQEFLTNVAASMQPGESFLLGLDLVKDPARLIAAYDDAAGVTAEFNRNVLHVLNREFGADFDPDRFGHVAHWEAEHEWIEMRLRASDAMTVRLADLDLAIGLERGEHIRTEISAKFRRGTVEAELGAAGLRLAGWWTDLDEDFALALATRP